MTILKIILCLFLWFCCGFLVFIVLDWMIELFFRNCKHPEKYATFQENIYGDEINYLDCRSLWKAKWWIVPLRHNKLYQENR